MVVVEEARLPHSPELPEHFLHQQVEQQGEEEAEVAPQVEAVWKGLLFLVQEAVASCSPSVPHRGSKPQAVGGQGDGE